VSESVSTGDNEVTPAESNEVETTSNEEEKNSTLYAELE
jgi:hypothetical protein